MSDWRETLPVHAAADLLPFMPSDEFDKLVDGIKTYGLLIPVTLIEEGGTLYLLDGRHRLDALVRAGIEVIRAGELVIAHNVVPPGTDPFNYVIEANLTRRHLTPEQRREVIYKMIEAMPGMSDRQIGERIRVHHQTVGRHRRALEATGLIIQSTTSVGKDGKVRTRPAPTTISVDPSSQARLAAAVQEKKQAQHQYEIFTSVAKVSTELFAMKKNTDDEVLVWAYAFCLFGILQMHIAGDLSESKALEFCATAFRLWVRHIDDDEA